MSYMGKTIQPELAEMEKWAGELKMEHHQDPEK